MAESQPEAGPSNPTSAALRPVKLAGVPDHWTQSTTIRQKLALLKDDVQQYEILGRKLENITDEPVWDAMIPFGPLAYFPGQLVHTNDITVSLPSPPPLPDEDSSATSPQPSSLNESRPILKSAKQARELAARDRARIERIVARTEEELSKAEEVGKKTGGDGLEEGWALNERGEVCHTSPIDSSSNLTPIFFPHFSFRSSTRRDSQSSIFKKNFLRKKTIMRSQSHQLRLFRLQRQQ
ncbi:hypothetical protein T439DRAFT_122808 [Meredithblackwellia eburnea MCA 4105]